MSTSEKLSRKILEIDDYRQARRLPLKKYNRIELRPQTFYYKEPYQLSSQISISTISKATSISRSVNQNPNWNLNKSIRILIGTRKKSI